LQVFHDERRNLIAHCLDLIVDSLHHVDNLLVTSTDRAPADLGATKDSVSR
jgi:hypothetical protein